jgi:hypothetical protein
MLGVLLSSIVGALDCEYALVEEVLPMKDIVYFVEENTCLAEEYHLIEG